MEPLHIKLEIGEAINAKKTLLSSEINLLNTVERIKSYKQLRKAELTKKSKLRTEMRKALTKIKALEKELPKTKTSKSAKLKVEISKKGKKTLETELRDIRKKLEMLG